jgi:hypothetical protein
MHDENKRLAKRALDEVFAQGRLDLVEEIFHPDFVNHEAGPQTPHGREGLKVTIQWIRSSFGDLSYELEDAIGEDDQVVLRVISKEGTPESSWASRRLAGSLPPSRSIGIA